MENNDAEFVDSMIEKLENRTLPPQNEVEVPVENQVSVVTEDAILQDKHLVFATTELKKSMIGGYHKKSVEQMLDNVNRRMNAYDSKVASLENEKNFLELQVKHHMSQLEQYHMMETSLKNSLIQAENMALSIEEKAQQEADQLLKEANQNANKIINEALAQAKKTIDDLENTKREAYIFKSRMKMMIQSQMEMFDDSSDENWNLDVEGDE
ncbi:MAG: DivIVA domain-containing protein [Culicoidibacterales bacterium]